jgi:protein-S-isoprenylcysteine O-methyltransferase Ste14
MQTAARTRYAIREILSLAGMAVALFWSTGRLDWWPAWAALAVMTIWTAATAVIVLHYRPELLAERLARRKGDRSWDAAIVGLLGLVTLVRYVLAGLDQRHAWTGGLPFGLQLAALALCVLGNDVLLASWPALVVGVLSAALLILRTALEDRTLQTELPGYMEYARHTRYRLFPGLC